MTLKTIYNSYEEFNKPYSKVDRVELLAEVQKAIDSIGNGNPHWNKLNEIENDLRKRK